MIDDPKHPHSDGGTEVPGQILSFEGKHPLMSRGVVGALITVIAGFAALAGWFVDVQEMTEIVLAVITIVGGILALIGRWKAKQPIRFTRTKPGGKFNEHAEVRKPKRYKFPKTGGFFVLSVPMACLAWIVAVGVMFGAMALAQRWVSDSPAPTSGALQESRSALVTPEKAREWLEVREVEDARPFLVRLADSLNPSAKVRAIYMRNADGDIWLAVKLDQVRLQGGAEF